MSQIVTSVQRIKAGQIAKNSNENAIIYKFKTFPTMITTVSAFEKSPNKALIEVIAIIDKTGNYVN